MNETDYNGLSKVVIHYSFPDENGKINEYKKIFTNESGETITKFLKSLPDMSIDSILIDGHGDKEYISIDRESNINLNYYDDGSVGFTDGKESLPNILNQKLKNNAIIHLRGCETAKGDDNIAKQLSKKVPNSIVVGAKTKIIGTREFIGDYTYNYSPKYYQNGEEKKE